MVGLGGVAPRPAGKEGLKPALADVVLTRAVDPITAMPGAGEAERGWIGQLAMGVR